MTLMFAIGIWRLMGGCIRFDFSDPLVALAALAHVGIGIPYFIASAFGLGAG